MWSYKWTGKAAPLTVRLGLANGSWLTQTITLKANGFVVSNFNYQLP